MKAQEVRLFDVLLLGPAMVVAGQRLARDRPSSALGTFLMLAGVGTVLYNLRNYERARR